MGRPVRLCGSSVLPGLVVLVVLCLLGSSVPARVLSPEGGVWLCAWEKEAHRRARLTPRLRTCCGRCRAGVQPRPWPRSSASTLAPPRCPAAGPVLSHPCQVSPCCFVAPPLLVSRCRCTIAWRSGSGWRWLRAPWAPQAWSVCAATWLWEAGTCPIVDCPARCSALKSYCCCQITR